MESKLVIPKTIPQTLNNITLVTAFYSIKSKFPVSKYQEWINNFMKIETNKIIFCDSYKYFKNCSLKNTLLIYLPIDDFLTSKYNYVWKEHHDIDHEKQIHSIDLYKIWNEKTNFIKKAIEINQKSSIDCDYYFWCDIGAFRDFSRIKEFIHFPKPYNLDYDKVLFQQINPFTDVEKKNITNIDNRFQYVDRVIGGLFGGHKNKLMKFHKAYYGKLNQFISNKIFAGKDQSIMAFTILENPEFCNIITCPEDYKYDPWFYLQDYLNKLPEKIYYISIIIPIYNGIEFLDECIQSVKNQTYPFWEILIGINGHESRSEVYQQAMKYGSHNIRVFDYPQFKSKVKTSNDLVTKARYDIICVLDVDDKWLPQKLYSQYEIYKTYNYDVIGTHCRYFGDLNISPNIPSGNIDLNTFKNFNPIINSSTMIKKELCNWDEKCFELDDYDLWIKLAKQNKSFYNIPKKLTFHRIHKTSSFNNINHNYVEQLLQKHYSDVLI